MMIYVQLGRFDEAKAAAWLKTGPHSVFAETCVPIREPMKQMRARARATVLPDATTISALSYQLRRPSPDPPMTASRRYR